MKFKLFLPIVLGLSIALMTNCKPRVKPEKEQITQDTTQKTKDTTTVQKQDSTEKVEVEEKVDPALKTYMKYAREEWDKVPATFEAKYMGYDIGDYPHIIFEDKKGKEYDFGDGANVYGTYKEEDFVTDNKSKFEGKTFKVTWEWKTSTFLCCDGEMEEHTGKVPSITNLELVK